MFCFPPRRTRLVAGLLTTCLLPTTAVLAQEETSETPPPPEHPLVTFLKEGKVNLDMRFRFEHADIDGAGDSNAFTMRTRLGYTTKLFEGFQGMIELEDNRAADYDEYNAAGLNGQPGLSVIADPEDTELNQLWLSYDFSNLSEDLPLTGTVGRQRINFDDQRFIGGVAWRQLEQTFDAAKLAYKPIEDLTATYVYIDEVNRIFGADSGLDFESDSHLLNVAYTGLDIGKIVGFAYLLDLGTSGAAVSSQTYGVRLDGSTDLNDQLALGYIGSVAIQSDYGANATSYDALYVLAEGKLKFKETAGGFVGAGYEMLGSDDGTIAFSTPLATGHKFNGFADSFLATPAQGLRDYYITGGTMIPGIDAKFVTTYHYFTGDDSDSDLGTEIDFVLAKKLNANMTLLAKYAYFDGDNARADIERFWLQLDLKF
ncbi:MAG: alginate export family protein [Phycisphaeraceae bacterium]|nr:alginate export family protein [Phycisphaeraceae bacterium]